METTIVYWGYIGIIEKKMEATIVYGNLTSLCCGTTAQAGHSPRLLICNRHNPKLKNRSVVMPNPHKEPRYVGDHYMACLASGSYLPGYNLASEECCSRSQLHAGNIP